MVWSGWRGKRDKSGARAKKGLSLTVQGVGATGARGWKKRRGKARHSRRTRKNEFKNKQMKDEDGKDGE